MRSLIPWRRNYPQNRRADWGVGPSGKDFNDLVNEFLSDPFNTLEGAETRPFIPAFDVSETDDEIRVKAELPGMDVENIDVNLTGNVLTVKGEKKEEKEEKGENTHRVERSFGTFSRSFSLPTEVDPDKVNASYKDGVLSLKMPKTEAGKKKNIKVQVR